MERYLTQCEFTDDERAIIELRRKGVSLVGMAGRLNMSPSSVSDRLASIQRDWAEVQDTLKLKEHSDEIVCSMCVHVDREIERIRARVDKM